MCLLAQINPLKATHDDDDEIRPVQLHHAHQVCGIVAHTKDHGVASVAIRSLAIAGSVLHVQREQHEVLDILTRIYHHTGWNLNRVHLELKRAWGWEPPEPVLNAPSSGPGSAAGLPHPTPQQPLLAPASQGGTLGAAAVINQRFGPRSSDGGQDGSRHHSQPPSGGPPAPIHPPAMMTPNETRRANFTAGPPPPPTTLTQPLFSGAAGRHNSVTTVASGASNHTSPAGTTSGHTPASVSSTPPSRPTVNPLLAQADFNQPNHPYRDWYKPPERTTSGGSGSFKAGGLWPY